MANPMANPMATATATAMAMAMGVARLSRGAPSFFHGAGRWRKGRRRELSGTFPGARGADGSGMDGG